MPGVEQQVMTKAHALITPVNSQHAKQDYRDDLRGIPRYPSRSAVTHYRMRA